MDSQDRTAVRGVSILNEVKSELLGLLKDAPQYGSCGIDIHFHQGKIIRVSTRSEFTRKLLQQGGH
jgi:hypothetical protein